MLIYETIYCCGDNVTFSVRTPRAIAVCIGFDQRQRSDTNMQITRRSTRHNIRRTVSVVCTACAITSCYVWMGT